MFCPVFVVYSRVKLKVQAKLVIEGFDEKRGAMEMFTSLKQEQKCAHVIAVVIANAAVQVYK